MDFTAEEKISLQGYNFPKWMKFDVKFITPNFEFSSSPSSIQCKSSDKDNCSSLHAANHLKFAVESTSMPPLFESLIISVRPLTHLSAYSNAKLSKHSSEGLVFLTPYSSPPGSPVLNNLYLDMKCTSTEFNSRGISPVQWIFQNFFSCGQQKNDFPSNVESPQLHSNNKNVLDGAKNIKRSFPSINHKKYNISNFDINALSPSSW